MHAVSGGRQAGSGAGVFGGVEAGLEGRMRCSVWCRVAVFAQHGCMLCGVGMQQLLHPAGPHSYPQKGCSLCEENQRKNVQNQDQKFCFDFCYEVEEVEYEVERRGNRPVHEGLHGAHKSRLHRDIVATDTLST